MKLDVFLNFENNTEEVAAFYEKCFGIKAEGMMKYKDMPPSEDFEVSPSDMEKVMYVTLNFGSGSVMMSDLPSGYEGVVQGNNMTITITFDDADKLEKVFEAMSEGGEVTMPLGETFFSKRYGELTDKFGVHWALLADDGTGNYESGNEKENLPDSKECIPKVEPRH